MRFFNWKIDLKVRRMVPLKTLPSRYEEYIEQSKLIVLPGKFYSPVEYFQDLVNQMKEDIYPLFRKTSGGAPFTVTRNTLCFIDHVAQLQFGSSGKQTPKLKKVFNQMGTVDDNLKKLYGIYSSYLIQIYRHDLVHNIRPFPKQIIIKTKDGEENQETWFFMCTECDGRSFEDNLVDMKKRRSRNGRAHLRLIDAQVKIDTFSLFYDTIILLEWLQNKSSTDPEFGKKITKNYYAILRNNYYSIDNFKLDQTINKQIIKN